MKLGITDIIGLISNKQKLAERIKEELPPLLDTLLDAIAAEGGAAEGEATAVTFFYAETETGKRRLARVNRIDEFGAVGEELACFDLAEAIATVPNDTITKILPF